MVIDQQTQNSSTAQKRKVIKVAQGKELVGFTTLEIPNRAIAPREPPRATLKN